VAGGSERQYSVWNGLKRVADAADVVLVHDAARPLVTAQTIEAVIKAAREQGAAIAAVPEKNTIKVVSDAGIVKSTPVRSTLWAVQTPQGFRKEILIEANEKAETDGFLGTDDASLVERLGRPVHVVMSDYSNIKVTTPEDLLVAEAFCVRPMAA
jgi:2-C-methyl-D-erythritol 4-phosphate cytidylyltransferase